jgi:hypothetical protein
VRNQINFYVSAYWESKLNTCILGLWFSFVCSYFRRLFCFNAKNILLTSILANCKKL